jgi:putative transposase
MMLSVADLLVAVRILLVRVNYNLWVSLFVWIRLQYIQPGKPQQNAYVERFNRTVRHEWLDQHLFASIRHAQETATQWLWRYNNERPNMALGGITPKQKLQMAV